MRVLPIVLAVLIAACGKDAAKPPPRTGSSVELVDQPIAIDGGRPAGGDEVEPNNAEDSATKAPLGATVRARIDADGDVDHFAIDVTTAGVLALDVSAIDGFDLTVDLEDATGTVVAKSDRGAVKVREGMPNFPVSVGRYTAVVRAKKVVVPAVKLKKGQKPPPPPPPAGPSPVYELAANVTPPAVGFEREPDDDRGAANELILGDPGQGFVGWTGDIDAWKLSLDALSAKNAIDIEVTSPESIALVVEYSDGVGTLLSSRKAPRGQSIAFRGVVPMIAAGAAPFHYLTIRADRSNPETPYRVKITEHVVGPDAESEPNDTPEKAMPMPSDRTTVKGIWTTADIDCYVLETMDTARKLEVSVDVPNEVDLFVEVLVDGKPVGKSDVKGKGAAEKLEVAVPVSGRPVIRVRATDPNAAGEGNYTLVVQELESAPPPPPP